MEHQHVVGRLLAALEARFALPFEIIARPDEVERTRKAVDFILSAQMAVEHTFVESFQGQITDSHRVAEWAEALEAADVRLPESGTFMVGLAPHAVAGAKPTAKDRQRVVQWITARAGSLQLGSGATAPGHMTKAQPPEVPFPFTLSRWPQQGDARLQVQRTVDLSDTEPRVLAVQKALRDKCPKLEEARPGGAGTTLLLIEQNDLGLGNVFDLAHALKVAAQPEILPLPDLVLAIDTALEPFSAFWLKEFDFWPEGGRPA